MYNKIWISFTNPTWKIFFIIFLISCNTQQQPIKETHKTSPLPQNVKTKLKQPLQVGDKIELSGGYNSDPLFLKNPPASKRCGTIIKFIKGQSESLAAVVKLDQKFSGEKVTGDIVILELRYTAQTWQEPTPVHIELCDFMPDDNTWRNRKKGEWIEAAASVTILP
ncbi:hypothetical protein [Filimonas effusa]|uniref:Uncharacterized protein n=1 Tax=Filimonas effusa TaxID=2508721 RepID=A0A4Q1DDX0_9BACT|nr:hypothetical protein [Filimonas effusa]RXK86883.1 hypothetical protein ESB13_08865 [Filimonas effusa]